MLRKRDTIKKKNTKPTSRVGKKNVSPTRKKIPSPQKIKNVTTKRTKAKRVIAKSSPAKKEISKKTVTTKPISNKSTINKTVKKTISHQKKTQTPVHASSEITRMEKPVPSTVLHIRVTRYNPLLDFTPGTHEYTINSVAGESILDLLTRIKNEQDGSLTFRGSCGYGGCGTCGVKVNGKPVLGCVTQVSDVADHHHSLRIDPLYDTPLKDLVVDEKPFFEELTRVKPWIVPRKLDERRHHKMGIADVKKLADAQQCILCGICNSNSSWEKTHSIGPAALVKAFRYVNDIRDGDTKRIPSLEKSLPVKYSFEKADLCPRELFPGKKITELEKTTRLFRRKTIPFNAQKRKKN